MIFNKHLCRDQEDQRMREEDFGDSFFGRVRKKLWNFLEYPETSIGAQALAFLSLFMVCVSTVTFIIGTNSEGEQEKQNRMVTDQDILEMDDGENITEGVNITELIDNVAVIFFSIEYFMRIKSKPIMVQSNIF